MSKIYDIYHDESKEEAYWHGFLFVPRSGRRDLLKFLNIARKNINFFRDISFKYIRKGSIARKKPALIRSWTSIALASLQQQKLLKLPVPFHLGKKEYIARLDNLIGCKFFIFKEKDRHEKMFYGLDGLRSIETTFRMGIKGAVHKLFCKEHPIIIGNLFIDGYKHYKIEFGRPFNISRSLKKFIEEKRDYVSFSSDSKFIPQQSNHEKILGHQKSEDSHLLQLCDILIGGFRFHSFCPDRTNIKHMIGLPCRELLSRNPEKYYRMKESRFYNGFSLNEAWLENGMWKFKLLKPAEEKDLSNLRQLELPLFKSK